MASYHKSVSKIPAETAEQLTEESELGELSAKQSTPLSPEERANKAYKLVYGENAEIPIRDKAVETAQDADWFVRSYMGGMFATPNDHPLVQKFSNLEELLTWFDETYPAQVDDAVERGAKVESVKTEDAG